MPWSTPALIPFPTIIRGTYYPYWSAVNPSTIPSGINTVFLMGARDNGNGGDAGFNFGYDPALPWAEKIQALRSSGRKVILSLGGAGETLSVTNPDNLRWSFWHLHNLLWQVDGIDWDIEGHTFTSAEMDNIVNFSRFLKSISGSNFSISISAAGDNTQWKQIGKRLNDGGDLDLFTIQYYDYPNVSVNDVADAGTGGRARELLNTYGIPYSKQAVGVKYIPDAGENPNAVWTLSNIWSGWPTLKSRCTGIKGVVLWDNESDRLNSTPYAFANNVATNIT